jgi:hypothetical protein
MMPLTDNIRERVKIGLFEFSKHAGLTLKKGGVFSASSGS